MSRVLVVNSGSSSLKYQLIELTGETTLARGLIERIGEVGAGSEVADHTAAFHVMIDGLREQGIEPAAPLAAIAHRVVHGGERFVEPTIVTEEVKHEIDVLSVLAPLHNPPNLAGIVAAEATFPGVPQVAVFDTAFHRTLGPAASTYAIDADLARRHGVRRYGFHGISFSYVSREAACALGRSPVKVKLIILHLGNGASACAVDAGRSVETSMGMTPLEGLVMGTRGGDIDPGVLVHLQRSAGVSVDELDHLLNHESGLVGLTGFTDIRDVQSAAEAGDEKSRRALEVYVHRLRSYIGSYLAHLQGADAIVFTAGVGENNPVIRSLAVESFDWLGVRVDAARNSSGSRAARLISADESSIPVLVVPTNEELEIARQALEVVSSR